MRAYGTRSSKLPTASQMHRRAAWLPQGARVGWLDVQDLFLDIDSAYRAAQAMVTDGDGLSVGVSALIKRFHESGRLRSIDQQRRKLKVRRMIDGTRLQVLHLPANGAGRSGSFH